MSSYKDILNNISENLLQFIRKYEQLDNNEPFSFAITDTLKKQIKLFSQATAELEEKYSAQTEVQENEVNALLAEYAQKEASLEAKLSDDIRAVSEKYGAQSDALKKQIEMSREKVKHEESDSQMDVEWFKNSNEQNIEMFEREHQESVSRYDYHHQVAMESYSQNTILYNNQLENDMQQLDKDFSNVLVDYDRETQSIIENYQKRIDKLLKTQKEKQENHEAEEFEHKDNERIESIKLNDKIRSLVQQRNDNIAKAKSDYANKQNAAQNEKETKRQNYQAESQRLSKQFVISMDELDEKMTETKNSYSQNTDMEKRSMHYRLLELKKEQEKELADIYETYGAKKAKRSARSINRSYFRYGNIELVNNKKTMENLTYGFNYAVEENNYDKKMLDIDRSYSIKKILEEENRDNKYYQEMNNIYEADMNLEIALENLDYSREANRIRSENSLTSVVNEKDFDEKLAIYQIENEQLSGQIKTIRNEINSLIEIKELIHSLEEKKYRTNLNFKTVYNTLEIEKHRVLDTFNKALYDLNVESAGQVLQFSKDLTYKKNDEFESGKKNSVARSYRLLDMEERDVAFQLDTFERNKELEIRVLKRNYFFELDKLGHGLLSRKWLLEIRYLQQGLSAFTQITRELEFMGIESSNQIFAGIQFRPEHVKIIWIFMKEFLTIIYNGLKDLIEAFRDNVGDTIDRRLEIEEDFKFKGFYKNLESQYQESMKELNSQKGAALSEMEKYHNQIEANNNLLFSIDNDLFLKKKMEYGTKGYRQAQQEARVQKKEINAENAKLTKTLATHTRQANRVQQKILDLDHSYTRQQDDIRKMQITNAGCYFSLKKDIEKLASSSISNLYQKVHLSDIPESELHNYEAITHERAQIFVSMNQEMFRSFEDVLRTFQTGEKHAIQTSADLLEKSYSTDILEIRRDAFNEENDAKDSYTEDIREKKEELRKFDASVLIQAAQFKKEIFQIDNKIKNISSNIQKEREQITDVFYEDYYAICANQQDIVNKLKYDISNFQKEYEEKRHIINEKFYAKNDAIKQSFREYKEKKEEDIRVMPVRVKENQKLMKEETHKKNMEIAISIDEAKIKSTIERKTTNRNLLSINSAFESKLQEIDKEKKSIVAKEKKKYSQTIRRL